MVANKRLSKHDRYVLALRDKIRNDYDSLSLNVKITGRKRSLGEVDILARKGNKIDLYEVKCSHRVVKARKQLERMQRILNLADAGLFFYCGASGILVDV